MKSVIFPSDWKFARVVPIPKGGDHQSPSNYRPISILPIISKLLEKHVHNLLYQHLSNNCLLSPNQWGFTEGKSTTTALLSFTHECQEALDNRGEVCSVFFDLCKAFDSVPHQSILHKLFHLQANPFLLRWIESYLSIYIVELSQLCWVVLNQTDCQWFPESPKDQYWVPSYIPNIWSLKFCAPQ